MATYYFRSTGTNWGTAGDWSATPSPTYSAGAVPTTADNAVFEAASANCTINTGATRNCVNLTCTNYLGILTFNTNLNVTGNVALGSATMSMTGSSTLALSTAGTTLSLSSAGCTCSVPMTMTKTGTGATITVTFASWVQSGAFTFSSNSQIWIWNSSTFTLKGNVAWNYTGFVNGTTTVLLAPDINTTMTFTGTFVRPSISAFTINGAGTININISEFQMDVTTFTYTAGTVTHTGTFYLGFSVGRTIAINSPCLTMQNGSTSTAGGTTINLSSDISFSGNFTIPSSSPTINPAGRTINVAGNYSNGGAMAGSANIAMTGTGSVSGVSSTAQANPLIINTSGTITFSGSIAWLRTLTFTAGTIVNTNSTITCNSASTFTLNAAGFSFATFSTTSNSTFTGTEGCTFTTFTAQTAGTTHTFQSTDTYTITSALNLLGTAASALTFRSSTAASLAIVTLRAGASLDVGHVTATDINSSNGRTIWVYKGSIGANTLNWQQLPTIPKTVGETWVR